MNHLFFGNLGRKLVSLPLPFLGKFLPRCVPHACLLLLSATRFRVQGSVSRVEG